MTARSIRRRDRPGLVARTRCIQRFGNQLHAVDAGDAYRGAGGEAGWAAHGPHGIAETDLALPPQLGFGQYTLLADIVLQTVMQTGGDIGLVRTTAQVPPPAGAKQHGQQGEPQPLAAPVEW